MTTEYKALKNVVVSMGLLLIGGMILLIALIFGKLSGQEPAKCPNVTLNLPAGSMVAGITAQGKDLLLLVNEPGGKQRLLSVDRCGPAIRQTLKVNAKPVPASVTAPVKKDKK